MQKTLLNISQKTFDNKFGYNSICNLLEDKIKRNERGN